MIRPGFLPVGISTSNRIIKPGYESYQPAIAARQFGLGQVPPHFHIHHLVESRADLPDGLTSSICYSMFDNLHIPIPADLSFTSSSIGFDTWWNLWKTHAFRKALGHRLQQIDPEYAIPEEEVLNLYILLFPDHPSFHLSNSNSLYLQQQDGPEPMTSNGEPFHFLPTAPDVPFCKGSPTMKKVIMTVQPDLLQSASKRRQTPASVAPRVLTKKRKMITRRVIKKPAPASPSPSESNTNQVTHFSETSSLSHTCVLWLTVILFPGRSWRHPQHRKPGTTWDDCNPWCTDGCKGGTSRYGWCSWCQHQL